MAARYIISLLAICLLHGLSGCTHGKNADAKDQEVYKKLYSQYSSLSPEKLNSLAEEYIEKQEPDSALLCYSMVISTDEMSHDSSVIRNRAKALNGMGYVLLYHKGDVLNAYDCFLQTKELLETNGLDSILAPVLINLGNITVAKNLRDASEYYALAMEKALASGDFRNANTAYSNLINCAVDAHDMSAVTSQMRQFASRQNHDTQPLDRYITFIHNGAEAFAKKDYRLASQYFSHAAEAPDTKLSPSRYKLQALANRTEALLLAADTLAALSTMKQIDSIAGANRVDDIRLSTYRRAYEVYSKIGDTMTAEKYRDRYYLLTDSLHSFSQGYDLKNVENNFTLKQMNHQMAELKHTSDNRKRVMWAAIGLIFVISIINIIIWHQKKRVDRLLTNLYEKNRLLISRQNHTMPINPTPASSMGDNCVITPTSTVSAEDTKNGITSEDVESIQNIMEQSTQIFNIGFGISDLADMTGIKEKKLSSIINSNWGMNFNVFLNNYRMQEAARRLENPDYNHLTIEAIAESIGLRNRSYFASLFRAATGMSPAEYRRAAIMSRMKNKTD